MKKRNLDKTFHRLRELPLEISFAQVEQWVRQSPARKPPEGRWLTLLFCQLFWNEN